MTGYEFLKFLHVAAVISWVGGGIGIAVLQLRLGAAGDRGGVMAVGRQMEKFGKIYFSPLAAVTLATGIWMVATSGFDFEDAWIVIGLAGIAVSMVIGLGFISPTGRKLLAESQKTPPDGKTMAGLATRMRMLSYTNLTLLMIVVWAMIVKPGG